MELTKNIESLIELAIAEDIGFGDVTSQTTIPDNLRANAKVLAREELIVCGLKLIDWVVKIGRFDLEVTHEKKDGDKAQNLEVLATLKGKAQHILTIERTILNFLQRMSGVATFAEKLVKEANSKIKILDTRKTMPGWRALDKYAVKVGGGYNHRLNLSDMILIKNNHIDLHKGDIKALFRQIYSLKPFYTPIQVEVRNEKELTEVLKENPSAILLDNMTDSEIFSSVKLIKAHSQSILIEASGGMTIKRVKVLSDSGIDCISFGSLTTNAGNKDISLRIDGYY